MLRLLLILAAFASPALASKFTSEVEIEYGKLKGFIVELNHTGGAKVDKYLGIPYAKAERFEPPQAPSKWTDLKIMNSSGKVCPQYPNPYSAKNFSAMSEDCLNLNVFVPHSSANSSSLLPVMVWIHGGGYVGGSNVPYDPSYLAVLGNVIVVVINYRLTVFGFLTNGKGGDIKGNYAMLDQVEALKWVQKNIKKFNGDPEKVTIFGESAGGASVSLHLLSKLSKGLFKRAIPQSGDAAGPWATTTAEKVSKHMKQFAKNMKCSEDLSKLRECLKEKTFKEIIMGSLVIPFPSLIPVIDGHFLEDAPIDMYKKQNIEEIDLMLGVTDDEGTIFANTLIPGYSVNITYGFPRSEFLESLRTTGLSIVIPNDRKVLINSTIFLYTNWKDVDGLDSNRRGYLDSQGDPMFVAPAVLAADAYSKKKSATYLYFLEYRYDGKIFGVSLPPWVSASHGADVGFIFDPLLDDQWSVNANFSRTMIRIWSNFAKTGNPNTPDSLDTSWPQYTHDKKQYMSLKPNMQVESHLRAQYTTYWNDFIPKALKATPKPCEKCPKEKTCSSQDIIRPTGILIFFLSLWMLWF